MLPLCFYAVGVLSIEVLQVVAVAVVVRRLRARLRILHRLVGLDPLTGLANRRGLAHAIQRFTLAGRSPGVLLADLVAFKAVNDDFGHDAGDTVLREVGQRLTAAAAALGGVAGRLGGDEFVVLLPGATAASQLTDAAEHLIRCLARPIDVPWVDEVVVAACVIGLALPQASNEAGVWRAADIALHYARRHSVPYAVYRPDMAAAPNHTRKGDRLRDRLPGTAVVEFDERLLASLTTNVESDDGHDVLRELVSLIGPGGRDFGTDVADLVDRCVELAVLRLRAPVTGISVEATVVGDIRDGGFRVLVHIDGAPTVVSDQLHPRNIQHDGDHTAEVVLAVVARTADELYQRFQAAHRSVRRWPS